MVQEIRRYMPRIGSKKLYFLLKPKFITHGIKLGRDNFFSYLRNERLLVKPKRSYIKTTYSKHWMKKHPNLLKEVYLKYQKRFLSVISLTFNHKKVFIIYL